MPAPSQTAGAEDCRNLVPLSRARLCPRDTAEKAQSRAVSHRRAHDLSTAAQRICEACKRRQYLGMRRERATQVSQANDLAMEEGLIAYVNDKVLCNVVVAFKPPRVSHPVATTGEPACRTAPSASPQAGSISSTQRVALGICVKPLLKLLQEDCTAQHECRCCPQAMKRLSCNTVAPQSVQSPLSMTAED